MLALTLSTCLVSCNDDDKDDVEMFMAFVTYAESSKDGSVFTTRPNNDLPLVTFTSGIVLDSKKYSTGKRYIIGYTTPSNKRFESGPISLMTIMNVTNGKAEEATLNAIQGMQNNLLEVSMLQREGQYLNIEATAPIQFQPKTFGIYVDDETIGNARPDIYIGFETDNTGGAYRTFFGSFDLSPIWDLPSCEGVRIHFHSNREQIYRDFDKTK